MKKRSLQMLAAGSLLAASVGQALAANVGGVELPLGVTLGAGQIYTNIPTAVGGELTGYGKIDSFNSAAVGDLCTNCELTYVFEDYELTSLTATGANFTGGTVRIYLGTGSDKDFSTNNPGSSVADDMMEASNGTLWLTLKGHAIDADGNTFVSSGTFVGTTAFTGSGAGLLDVDTSAGGTATAFFDSNSVPAAFGPAGGADFYIGSSVNGVGAPYPNTLSGSMDLNTTAVPEPQTYALMLSALGIIGYVVNRRRRT